MTSIVETEKGIHSLLDASPYNSACERTPSDTRVEMGHRFDIPIAFLRTGEGGKLILTLFWPLRS